MCLVNCSRTAFHEQLSPHMRLLTTANPDSPVLDMKLTHDLLQGVAMGTTPATLRAYRPGPTVAFGRLDRLREGFVKACRTAEAHGRVPVTRLGGGSAVAYDRDCVVVEVIRPRDPHGSGTQSGFVEMVDVITAALAGLGVHVLMGELPEEYCPGKYSLHLPDGPKVAGVAQRVVAHASLTTAVVVVGGGDAHRAILGRIYSDLDHPLNAGTVGAVDDQHPHVNCDTVMQAIVETFADHLGIRISEQQAWLPGLDPPTG